MEIGLCRESFRVADFEFMSVVGRGWGRRDNDDDVVVVEKSCALRNVLSVTCLFPCSLTRSLFGNWELRKQLVSLNSYVSDGMNCGV